MQKGDIYRHYKGKDYRILGIGHHSENLEKVVIYQGLYDDPEFGKEPIWVRPYHMFVEEIEFEGQFIKRFTKIDRD